MIDDRIIARAQGCMLGQLAGDALGSQVEFSSPQRLARDYPYGVRDMRDGGYWNTMAGQPTDDSEMALLLARLLARERHYDLSHALKEYKYWLDTNPFDVGSTIGPAISRGELNISSQANGAMMRVSPIGIFGAMRPLDDVALMAQADSSLTHPNSTCIDANALFAIAIATAIRAETTPSALYGFIYERAVERKVSEPLLRCIQEAANEPPSDFIRQQGWVMIAFQNALYRLLHSSSMEEGIIETVMCGGDTDTNAAIAGALLGAVHGRPAVPQRWVDCILNCRPAKGAFGVHQPRPEIFWPVDALDLATSLLTAGRREPETRVERPRELESRIEWMESDDSEHDHGVQFLHDGIRSNREKLVCGARQDYVCGAPSRCPRKSVQRSKHNSDIERSADFLSAT